MANQSTYVSAVTNLNGGLDLANPKQAVSPGSLHDDINVEVAERVGYKQIDGIEKHDGRIGPSAPQRLELISVVSAPGFHVLPVDVQKGDILLLDGEPWALVVSLEVPADPDIAGSDYTNVYVFGNQPVEISNNGIGFTAYSLTIQRNSEVFTGSLLYFIQQGDSALESSIFCNEVYDDINGDVGGLPDNRRAHGLHWFRDRLYAVANMVEYNFVDGDEEVFPNDEIEDSSGNTAIIRNIEVTSGDWSTNDAAGKIWVVNSSPDPLSGFVAVNRPNISPVPDVLQITTAEAMDDSQYASLWRTTEQEFVLRGEQTPDGAEDYGWNPIDMGYLVTFEDGDYPLDTLPTVNRRNQDGDTSNDPVISSTDTTNTDFAPQAVVTTTIGPSPPFRVVNPNYVWSGTVPDDIEAEDTLYLQAEYTTPGPFNSTAVGYFFAGTPVLSLTEFPGVLTDVPIDASIEGIEFQIRVYSDIVDENQVDQYALAIQPVGLSAEATAVSQPIPLDAVSNGTKVVMTYGGPEDKWGMEQITRAELADVNFGIKLQQWIGLVPAIYEEFDRRFRIDEIKLKVYYTVSSPKIYFWDGVDDVSALIANTNVTEGSFPLGTAEGTLHLYDLTPEAGAIRQHINPGDELRTRPGGEGNLIAVVVDNLGSATLPSLSDIVDEKSRYQFITANFYANEAWDAIYGVSGAGRAFVYDQQYFRYIYTGLGDDLDKPRHIEFHIYHLALGYKSGSVFISVVGDPENFSGVQGAFETSTGDRVTGLLSLQGSMLAIGCQRSVWGLAGSRLQDFTLQTLKPYEGVIEYTFVDMGFPVYCSNTGITIFNNTPAYGDFNGDKVSYNVYPFLYPRLYRQASRGVNQRSVGVVFAMPIRRKNQLLVWCQDGYVLCMTATSKEGQPSFTFRRYHVYGPEQVDEGNEGYLVPIAHTVENDSLGREQIFVSHFNTDIQQSNENENLLPVFGLDRGWSFAGDWFPWFFSTNLNFAMEANPSPNDYKVNRKLKLYGLSYGISHLSASVSPAFDNPSTVFYDVSMPPPVPATGVEIPLQEDLQPYTSNTASVAQRGEYFTVTVKNTSPKFTEGGEPIERVLPPVVCQVMLQQFDPAREGA